MESENLKDITIEEYINFILNPIRHYEEIEMLKQHYIKLGAYKKPKDQFDVFGLRYELDFLTKVKNSICFLPVQLMADFVDEVTFSSYKEFTDNQIIKFNEDLYNHINATSVGNAAFIYLNTKDNQVKEIYYDFLTELMRYEIELSGLTNQFKKS